VNQERVVSLASTIDADFGRRIDFLLEIDKLKSVLRRTRLVDGSRYENTAEHSWHLAMLVMILAPHARPEVDVFRAMKLLVVHDLVEIDAGDTFAYDVVGHEDKEEREQAAADRIFALLPSAQGAEVRALWDEYEARSTPTAVFAYACDRLQPMLLNASSGGVSWQEHGIQQSQVKAFNAPVGDAAAEFWELALAVVGDAVGSGQLGEG
jgi:putative hydrolase of HD superfamily